MKKGLLLLFPALAALLALAEPSLQMSLDRDRIYLGESVVARLALNDGGRNPPTPRFENSSPGDFDYRGPQTSVSSYTTFVNGRRESSTVSATTFTFVITPAVAGAFETGSATVVLNGKTISCPSARVQVIAPQDLDFVSASLSCTEKSVLVDGRFRIEAAIAVRALPEPNGDVEPIHPQRPLGISAAYLNFPEIEGLQNQPAQEALSAMAAKSSSMPFFTINDYQTSAFDFPSFGTFPSFGSAFQNTPVHFRPAPERVVIDGTNWWKYVFSVEYLATAEGTYSFGPLSLKGSVITGARANGTAELQDLYVVAPPVEVRVTPPPEEGRPAWYSGGVGRSMAAKASLDAVKCKVGDPLTLTLDITGDVNAAAIRPPAIGVQPDMPDSFRIYGEHVESESIEGGKRFKYRLRPLVTGTLEFPPILTAFYDSAAGEYVTVSTDPIPLQVDATTQIAISAADEKDVDGEGATIPDGIINAATDDLSVRLPFGIGAIDAESLLSRWPRWLLLPPAAWLLLLALGRALHALRQWLWATRHRRAARRARRRYASAVRARRPDAALPCARALAAALLEEDAPSLTAAEFRARAAARGIDASLATPLADAMEALEKRLFSAGAGGVQSNGGEVPDGIPSRFDVPASVFARRGPGCIALGWRVFAPVALSAALLGAVAALGGVGGARLQRAPDAFEWERAQGAMAAAQTEEHFAEAARLYSEMAEHGAATGPLYHNMGVALLLAGEPRAAARALDRAFHWRGASPELVNNRAVAQRAMAAEDGKVSPTPPPLRRIVPPIQWRLAAGIGVWLVVWLALALRTIARNLNMRAATILAAALLATGASDARAQLAVHAYARPDRVYVGQDFEICLEISLPQASDLNLPRPSGLPASIETGEPFSEGIVKDTRAGGDGGQGIVIRAVMPAHCAEAVEVAPASSMVNLGIVERRQMFFGTSTRTVNRIVPVEWTPFEVLPLPDEGRPEGFSGAVGEFSLESKFEPRDLAEGDIARWEISLRGRGRLNGAGVSAPALDAELFKSYPAESAAADGVLASVARTVVPLSTQAVEIAAASFDYFDPKAGRYARATAPAIPISVRGRGPEEAVSVKTIDLASPQGEAVTTNVQAMVLLRLAPAETARKTHVVAPGALQTLEEAPGGWRRVRDATTGHTGWVQIGDLKSGI